VALGIALPTPAAVVAGGVDGASTPAAAPLRSGDLRVVVTPPGYANRPVAEALNPTSMTVLEGSRLRLETGLTESSVTLLDGRDARMPFTVNAGVMAVEIIANSSQALIVRRTNTNASFDRLLYLRVDVDQRPTVRIARPAQDLVFAAPAGQVPIDIEARDDVGLASVALKYTVVSGSGEAFTFKEGEWPVDVARSSAGEWRAGAQLPLAALQLQDGDTLVYRAIARDAKPGAEPASSETYLIEIGKLGGFASTGFALPEDRDRQGLSQQMLIVKTERLHANRPTLGAEALVEQSRLLAIEQRMVKAEFVFMTGGEVADEVEEATSAHELAEGRLENSAQVELLTAIREMSRAESRLNDANTAQALIFERAALSALQRAFDRRRYLLRTLPERTRIDVTRRLTGDLAAARSSSRSMEPLPLDPVVGRARELLRELPAARTGEGNLSSLASRVIAVEPSSETLQKAAVLLASAIDRAARETAVQDVERALVQIVLQRLPSPAQTLLRSDPVVGRLVQEVRRKRGATP
jgi:hypothetical protein